jgi:hypothetical protein
MSISYPLTFPSSVKLNGVTPAMAFVNSMTRSPFTNERQAFRWFGEMWTLDYTTPPCEAEAAEDFIAFCLKLRGSFGTFLMGDQSHQVPRGLGGGTPLVNGANQVGYDLIIDGCPNSVTGWLLKGDYFQLGTGLTARLYKLTEDANTDSGGHVTLEFVPQLRISPADNAALVITNPVGLFCMANNSVTWTVDTDGFYHYSFTCQEAI